MILGFIDHDRGVMNKVTLEMFTVGRALAEELDVSLNAVLIGVDAEPFAEELAAYGVEEIFHAEHDNFDQFAPEAWAQSIVELIGEEEASVLLGPGTDRAHEVLAHVAARMDLAMAANCIEITPNEDEDHFELTRIRWGGSLLEDATLSGDTKIVTVAPFMIPAEEGGDVDETEVTSFTPELSDKDFRVRVTSQESSGEQGISLTDARVVVGGGRGVGSADGFGILQELAGLINGAVGGSRVATNLGWRPHSDQIGQTGTRIAPDLYIACGISGAIQHWVGCKGSKEILAINTDPEAMLVAKADYAVIGDLHDVIPAVIEEIKRIQGS